MNRNRIQNLALTSTLLLALGAGAAIGADLPAPTRSATAATPARVNQASGIARQWLNLQPGDEDLLATALAHPIVFTAVRKEREFTSELIVHAKAGKGARAADRVSALTLQSSDFVPERVIRVPAGISEGEMASLLMATGDYEFVEPNWLLYPAIVPNDPQYGSSWQHNRIDSARAWDLNTGRADVIVAVCDSGVDLDHPDLQAALVPGFNSASRRAQDQGGDVNDINGHGSFVAGCAAAQGNNAVGVTGVGWNLSIMPVRVTNNSNGTAGFFSILEGARWAADNGASVVNVSFTGGTSASNQTTGRYLKSKGALLFWAAGNASSFVSPNRPDYVLVSSTTSSDRLSGFSNYGPAVDVAAPGSGVRSTQNGGGYGNSSGTSFASPIAAGVGAMIYSVNAEFSADDVQDILYRSADDLGAPGRDDSFGHGRVNTYNAVVMAQSYIRPRTEPIDESFEDSAWQQLLVTTTGSADTAVIGDAPDGVSVLMLNSGDSVETVPLAGRSLEDAVLSFDLRATSIEQGESLQVQYLQNPDTAPDTWVTLLDINGQGRTGEEFVAYDITLPDQYQWHGVKLRFAAIGDDASDTWEIDALHVHQLDEPVAPLVGDFETGLISPARWDTADNASVVYNDGRFFAALGDAATLTSRDVPLLQFGFVQPYLRFAAWKDASVASSDTLGVEVFTIGGTWHTVATLTGSDLSTSPQLMQFDMPIFTWGVNNMKLRLTTSTAGSFLIDDVYLGVDPVMAGCSDADLAEPYGVLNFFDISAFLSAFSSEQPEADINGDGVFNFFDVSGFLTAYGAGCP